VINQYARFLVFTAVKIQIEIFCVVMPCSIVVGYQRFRGWFPTATRQKTSTIMINTAISELLQTCSVELC